MFIEELHLEDFLSHKETKIHFTQGMTAIVGANGAGKTSLIDAIIFALFNEKVRGEKMTDLIRRGSSSGKATVSLKFSEGGRRFTLRRERGRRGGDAELFREDSKGKETLIARGQNEVSEEVQRILGMDKETALNSVFVRQGEIAHLIDASPAERKKIIGRLIGLDKLEKSWENMREVEQYFEEKAKKYDVLKARLEEKEEQLRKVNEELKSVREEKEENEKIMEGIRREYEKVKREYEEQRRRREAWQKLSEAIKVLSERLKAESAEVQRVQRELEEAENAFEEMRSLERKVQKSEILEEYARILADIERFSADLKREREERERVFSLTEMIKRSEHAYKRFSDVISALNALRDEEKTLKEHERRFLDVEAKREATLATLKKLNAEIEHLRETAMRFSLTTVSAKKERLHALERELSEKEEKLQELVSKKGRLNGRICEIAENIRILDAESECPVCKRPLEREHKERVKREFEEERRKLLEEIERSAREIASTQTEIERLQRERDAVRSLDIERLEKLEAEAEEVKEQMKEYEASLAELSPKIERLRGVQAEIERLEAEKSELEKAYQEHIASKKALNGRNLEEIERRIRDLEVKIQDLEAKAGMLVEKMGFKPSDVEAALKEMRSAKERYVSAKAKASLRERLQSELSEARERLKHTKKELEEKERERDALGFSPEKHDEIEREFRETERKLTAVESSLNELRKREGALLAQIAEISASLSAMRKELAELERLRDFLHALRRIRDAFSKDKSQRVLRERLAPLISEYTREFLECFNLEISDCVLDEDFDVVAVKKGGEISVKAMSGGEKVAVAISLRLAIAKALSGKITTVIMDEPTTHLDEERRRELVEILKNFFKGSSSILPQMIVVTHHREIEDAADNLILIENVGGVSQVKTV